MPSTVQQKVDFATATGANYFVCDLPLVVDAVSLVNENGAGFIPGDKIVKIGKAARTSFNWPEKPMVYRGTYKHADVDHAVFSPEPNPPHKGKYYYYAFTIVTLNDKLKCFLVFTSQGNGCMDIDTSIIEKI